MKYELLVQTEWNVPWAIIDDYRCKYVNVPLSTAVEYWIIKEVPEPKRPKFKVGDYVVHGNRFMKIQQIKVIWETMLYDGFLENALRTPTKEELELYFR